MRDETRIWFNYSEENLQTARILLKSRLFNPCLQNVQQCVEKVLKALLIERSIKLKRTHSISELKNILFDNGIKVNISDDDCEFLDSIYLPSKYPVSSVLPYYKPDLAICEKALAIAENIFQFVKNLLK